MKPAPFKYIAAVSLEQALELKSQYGEDASFLAGGQSLIPTLNFRLAQPAVIIDINPLTALAGIARHNGHALRIGALTRYRALERDALVADALPLVREALPHVAHPQIRNRGTLGGNLAHSDPASEMPAVVLALGGRLRAKSASGERWIEAREFFLGLMTTALAADEMLVEIELPVRLPHSGACFLEMARRRGDYALIGVAVVVTLDDRGNCAAVSLVLCGAGDAPVDLGECAAPLVGGAVGEAEIAAVAAASQDAIDPPGSIHAGKDFQRHLAGVLIRRALATAAERAKLG